MDCWLQSSKLANRPHVCWELLTTVVEKGSVSYLNHLVTAHKADVNAAAHGSKLTLLQQVCRGRGLHDRAMVEALIQHGADVFAVTEDRGENALHMTTSYAALGAPGSSVHSAAAVVSQANREYQTAVTAAAAPAAVAATAAAISAAAAVATPTAPADDTAAAAAAAVAAVANPRRLVSQQNRDGQTPLHVLLCRCGAKYGPARSPAAELLRPLLEIDSAELRRALPLQDNSGKTALHMAVEEQHLEAMQQLLEAGARLDMLPALLRIQDSSGADVLCLATRAGGEQLLSLLAQHTSEVRLQLCYCVITYLHLCVVFTERVSS
jgi:Ankyrin repeats (3 copies)